MRLGSRTSGSVDRFGGGTQAVAVSWAMFAGLLAVTAAVTTLSTEACVALFLGLANAAAGLWLQARLRR